MTKDEWARFEDALATPWGGGAKLWADGHDLSVRVVQVKQFRFAIVVYIDGKLESDNMTSDSALGAKFYREKRICVYTAKDRAAMTKRFGKRWAKKQIEQGTVTIFDPSWGAASTLRRHLQKTCKEIQLVRAGHGIAEVQSQ